MSLSAAATSPVAAAGGWRRRPARRMLVGLAPCANSAALLRTLPTAMKLDPVKQDFVLHFGEMGSRWGINRTVGQIYALLFLSEAPLNADQICDELGFSRSNVSMGLKELQAWNLVRLQHQVGDRRDYFTTPEDLWEIVRTLIDERKKREIDPTLSKLRSLLLAAEESSVENDPSLKRVQELKDLFELLTGWYEDINQIPTDRLVPLLRLGAAVQRVLMLPERMTGSLLGRGEGSSKGAPDAETIDPD